MQNVGIYLQKKIENLHLKFVTIATPFPLKNQKQIEKEYGCPLNKKFKKVLETPVGSASISQVHKAILKNGML